jgi:hypothetical protein
MKQHRLFLPAVAGILITLTAWSLGSAPAVPAGAKALTSPPLVSATDWTVPPTNSFSTLPAGNATLNGVACPNSSLCWAVGQQGGGAGGGALLVPWVFNGWQLVTNGSTPDGTTPGAELNSISCAGGSFCMAVGGGENGGTPLALVWNNYWNQASGPSLPAGATSGELSSVSCPAVGECEALGTSFTGSTATLVAYQWSSTTTAWTPVTVATPSVAGSPPDMQVTGMDCVSATWCLAVGDSDVQSSADVPISEQWNGSAWTLVTTPPGTGTGDTGSYLKSVSCDGTSFCKAVGAVKAGGGAADRNLVETWNGSTWSVDPGVPQNAPNTLRGVNCFSATACTAVGAIGSGATQVLNWNGATWSLVPNTPQGGPSGSPAATSPNAVTCLSNWNCIAVGSYAMSGQKPFIMSAPITRSGYRFVASDGGVFAYGAGAPFLGSAGGLMLNKPVVGMGVMPAGDGYDLVASDGGVFNYGSARFYGSTGGMHLNKPVVGMAVTPDGAGYWLVASDGGVFNYGDAQFFGSTGSLTLNKPVVGMASSPDGKGYFLVAADGGVFAFGDAQFAGSEGGQPLNEPMVGMAATVSGGYYLVAADGGVFNFPVIATQPGIFDLGIPFFGSTGGLALNAPIVGMTTVPGATTNQGGYFLAGSDGGVFSYGAAQFIGSTGGMTLNKPIVGIAS